VSHYESAPGTAPIRIVPYPSRSPAAKPTPAMVDREKPAVPDVSYMELIARAALEADQGDRLRSRG
jgi:hypothetical protein